MSGEVSHKQKLLCMEHTIMYTSMFGVCAGSSEEEPDETETRSHRAEGTRRKRTEGRVAKGEKLGRREEIEWEEEEVEEEEEVGLPSMKKRKVKVERTGANTSGKRVRFQLKIGRAHV